MKAAVGERTMNKTMLSRATSNPHAPAFASAAVAVMAISWMISGYQRVSQAYDEPAHIACGMEWLEKGTFTLEPMHPPLPRVASAIGPYLAGLRLSTIKMNRGPHGDSADIFGAGNDILNSNGRAQHNLILARLGQIPFFCIAAFLIFVWARDLFGPWPAFAAIFMFSMLPGVLAFAALAYVDFSLAVFLPLTLYTFVQFLNQPSARYAIFVGVSAGLAVLSNFTVLLFIPLCMLGISACWWWFGYRLSPFRPALRKYLASTAAALAVSAIVIWGGYRFSIEPLQKVFANPAQDVAKVSKAPGFAKRVVLGIAHLNLPLPAPALWKGLVNAWGENKYPTTSYLMGRFRKGGVWYFYPVVLGVKTPLAFLLLAGVGVVVVLRNRSRDWRSMAPAVSVIAIVLAGSGMALNLGLRHILFIYIPLTICAAGAVSFLFQKRTDWARFLPVLAVCLIGWQSISTVAHYPDYIGYFNELAGNHPDRYLLFGCDLDCGQDIGKLPAVLKEGNIQHLNERLWTSQDLSRLDLPAFSVLPPYQPSDGWIAISLLHLRSGDAIWNGKNADGYAWLNKYQPVARVGRTIDIYHLPKGATSSPGSR